MIYQFKQAARVPDGITADQVQQELDDLRAARPAGTDIIDYAVEQVLTYPDKYPSLRAFGAENAEAALRESIRNGITYAQRIIIRYREDPHAAQVRHNVIVVNPDGDQVIEPMETVAKVVSYQQQVTAVLAKDAQSFANRLRDVLAELAKLNEAQG